MSGKSKYMAIYEWLSSQIAEKKFLPGDKIPGEVELAEMFGVHRMTVRQAINKLVGDHILVRKRSKGTFLLSTERPVLTRSLESISTFHDDIVAAGLRPHYQPLEARIVSASEMVARELKINEGEDVVYVYRLMLASDVPLALEESYLPAKLVPGLEQRSLDTILYSILQKDYAINLRYSKNEISAVLPSKEEKKLLKVWEHCPCMRVDGVVYDEAGIPVEFARALCRGDKYRFRCSIGKYVYQAIQE